MKWRSWQKWQTSDFQDYFSNSKIELSFLKMIFLTKDNFNFWTTLFFKKLTQFLSARNSFISKIIKNKITSIDVLWCQPIKLIQVVSTSEFHEYWWNDVDFIFLCPLHLVQGLRSLQHWLLQKLSMKIFDQKFDSSLKNRYFSSPIFQESEIFYH